MTQKIMQNSLKEPIIFVEGEFSDRKENFCDQLSNLNLSGQNSVAPNELIALADLENLTPAQKRQLVEMAIQKSAQGIATIFNIPPSKDKTDYIVETLRSILEERKISCPIMVVEANNDLQKLNPDNGLDKEIFVALDEQSETDVEDQTETAVEVETEQSLETLVETKAIKEDTIVKVTEIEQDNFCAVEVDLSKKQESDQDVEKDAAETVAKLARDLALKTVTRLTAINEKQQEQKPQGQDPKQNAAGREDNRGFLAKIPPKPKNFLKEILDKGKSKEDKTFKGKVGKPAKQETFAKAVENKIDSAEEITH